MNGLKQLMSVALVVVSGCVGDRPNEPIVAAPRDSAAAVDQFVDKTINDGVYPFLYVRLESADGELIYEKSAVNRDLIPTLAINGDSWMRIWSMTKLVTIVATLDLVEDGVLSLSDPVTDYLPELADTLVATGTDGASLTDRPAEGEGGSKCPIVLRKPTTTMTVEHLLTHEAGFYYATTNIPCIAGLVADSDLPNAGDGDDFVKRVAALPLIQNPGSLYYYGTNTSVLGVVLERAAGKSLAEIIKERITGPLRIEGLAYHLPEGAKTPPRFDGGDGVLRPARDGELDIFGGPIPSYGRERRLFLGGEGMVGTASGYAKFIRMVLGRGELGGVRILDESSINELIAPRSLLESPYGYNGYNLWISNGYRGEDKPRGPAGVWVGGGYEGTRFWIDPDKDIVGVIMTQVHDAPHSEDDPIGQLQILLYEMLIDER